MKHKTTFRQKLILTVLSVLFTLILIETGMRLTGFFISSYQFIKNRQALKETGAYRILCIGESTTFSGVPEHSYPFQLENILNQRNLGVKFRVINEGILGVDSGIILANLKDNLNEYAPDIVVTMIGVNDGKNDRSGDTGVLKNDGPVNSVVKKTKVFKLINHIWLHANSKYTKEKNERDYSRLDPALASLMRQAYKHIDKFEFKEAEQILFKAMAVDPNHSSIYSSLGGIYAYNAQMDLAIQYLKKAIVLDPKNEEAYSQLSMRYFYAQQYSSAIETILEMIKNIPDSDEAYEKLAQIYFKQKEYGKLEEVLKIADEKFPDSLIFNKLWASYYLMNGKIQESESRFAKAARLEEKYLSPLTIENYRRIKESVLERGIKLVSVQYPLRKLEPLKKMLGEEGGVVFVDNEKIFKDAVKNESYEQYFVDNFAGDFGHLSTYGNKLIAENIAEEIITNFFN